MADIIVDIKNLHKSFAGSKILDDISLQVCKGENLVVFGRSGTGKSVLLKCIIGLLKPESGQIFIEGSNTLNMSDKQLNAVRKEIGFLFQSGALYDSMTVRENLAFPLIRNFKFSNEEVNKKVISALELVDLVEAIDKTPSELSGGMRKRIALARTIITEPKLMLYDEPTTGLDPLTTKEISELIIDLQKKLNMTSIVVTHDLICASIIADRAIFLKDAIIQYQGTIEELTSSKDPFLRNFFSRDFIKA
ncbi:MAG: ATP-binding cassette domain-containing protein [Ignavibacteria bacterium]